MLMNVAGAIVTIIAWWYSGDLKYRLGFDKSEEFNPMITDTQLRTELPSVGYARDNPGLVTHTLFLVDNYQKYPEKSWTFELEDGTKVVPELIHYYFDGDEWRVIGFSDFKDHMSEFSINEMRAHPMYNANHKDPMKTFKSTVERLDSKAFNDRAYALIRSSDGAIGITGYGDIVFFDSCKLTEKQRSSLKDLFEPFIAQAFGTPFNEAHTASLQRQLDAAIQRVTKSKMNPFLEDVPDDEIEVPDDWCFSRAEYLKKVHLERAQRQMEGGTFSYLLSGTGKA